MDRSAEENSVLSFLDSFTAGLASELIPTQAVITIRLLLEFNNTNSYDVEFEQLDEGVIEIPANDVEDEDLLVGTWNIASSTLEGKARGEIPVEVTATIDLFNDETVRLGGGLVTGQPVVFRIRGELVGFASWAPSFKAHVTLNCLANVDNVFDLDAAGASIVCQHSAEVGKIIEKSGELVVDGDGVDPSCLV
eukprot:CAMPEP_0181097450 /NCGR_PEP_ID=MMETSP1071-20121207/11575_1 /TAXON_ID=35127 /ORGANISM="Thalassiosira sp., Strain NH16" /LENGTH=192 /DNA_ID=CAMNT_0023179931 /DNA_START=432 /DNA_END=1010 /DNA_ORIENTATION=-